MSSSQYQFHSALYDFQSARQKAGMQEILARLTGKSTQLLSYEEVAEKLKLHIHVERGIQNIPLDAIVGSVGRYTDFTRTFLPLRDDDRERWARVKVEFIEGQVGLPPIEVYKVGEAYFVIDGNHRVSIARQEGFVSIGAHVIEVKTDIPFTSDVQPDDLIIKAEYAEFLHATLLADSKPNVDLSLTAPGQYGKLMDQILVCQQLLQQEQKREVSLQDAAAYWYDNIYLPVAETIRDRGLLRWFPQRTIPDLYVWISENRAALEKQLGWEIKSGAATTDLLLKRKIQSEPGSWRKSHTAVRYTECLFADILVPLSGNARSWASLEQAILIAQKENARIHGLHIVDSREKILAENALAIQAKFNQRCIEARVQGSLAVEAGEIPKKICERATMTDLVVLMIVHPPMGGLSTLRSPFRLVLADTPRPVLGIPVNANSLQRTLLAYDGSPLSKEALFVATYLAEIWKTELTVFTAVDGSRVTREVQDDVRSYLDLHEVKADFVISEQGATEQLNRTVDERRIDLVLMGSHGGSTIRQVLIGSVLDYMLRESKVPVFVCR